MDRITNKEISQWIDNDEGLYCWWKMEKLSKKDFIRKYKKELSQAIRNIKSGQRRPHFVS